jgi:hypothetical protein
MEGIRAFLLALLMLLGIGLAPAGTSANAGSTDPAASPTLSQPAPVPTAVHTPPVAPTAAPAPTTGSPTAKGGGHQPAWKIVSASSLASTGASSPSQPFFRGGVRSRGGTASSGTPAPGVATPSPKIAVYNGLNKPGEIAANNGGVPPDSTGAIGPNNYVEMVNTSIAVYDRSLNLVNRATLGTLVGLTNPWCDPQIQWDPAANRWLFVVLNCTTNTSAQGFVVGWSRTADPTALSPAGWCSYGVVTNPDLFDYPKLGHNSNYLIVGGNFYDMSLAGPPFVGSAIAWFPLPAPGDASCAPTVLNHSGTLVNGDGTTLGFTPVPVNTISGATDGYVLAAYDAGGNVVSPRPQSRLAVYHIDSAGTPHQDADITVNTYAAPLNAPQSGTSNLIDTLDGRLTQAVGDPTTGIWTQHTVNGPGNRSEVDWYELTFPGSFPIPTQQGIVSSPTDFVFNAAISPTSDAQGAAIEYNRSSSSIFPVIGAQVRRAGTAANQMEPGELVLATSSALDSETLSCNVPSTAFPCRWGDYSAATPDPVQTNVVWGSNEFNTASGPTPAWSDENFALLIAAAPHAPTGVVARAGDQSAWVGWTPASFDAGTPTTSYKLTAYVGASPVATLTVTAPDTAAIFKGLTNGTTYTFTVIAINVIGPSPESAHSNAVTPTRAVQQLSSPGPTPSRSPVNPAPTATPAPR